MLWLQKQARPFSMWTIRQTEPGKVSLLLSVRIWTERSSSLVSGLGRVQVTGERRGVRRGRGRDKYRQTDRERKKEEKEGEGRGEERNRSGRRKERGGEKKTEDTNADGGRTSQKRFCQRDTVRNWLDGRRQDRKARQDLAFTSHHLEFSRT